MRVTVYWDATACNAVDRNRHFGWLYGPHHQETQKMSFFVVTVMRTSYPLQNIVCPHMSITKNGFHLEFFTWEEGVDPVAIYRV
jgi:hypothetical protein